jgi:hypothetical protein
MHFPVQPLLTPVFTIQGWLETGFGLVDGFIDHFTHDSELQAITAPPLISTIYKSLEHPLGLLQPAVSSPTVPWQRLQTLDVSQLQTLTPLAAGHRLATELIAPAVLVITCRHRPRRKHPFPKVTLLLLAYLLQRERFYRAQKLSLFTKLQLSKGSVRHNM